MPEVADLWAAVGARVNTAQWSAADKQIAGTEKKLTGLGKAFDGAFQDRAGRWRAASGRYLTMKERAELAATGIKGAGDAADKAGKKAQASVGAWGAMRSAAVGALAFFGVKAGYDGLIKFNATAEESRNQIAGMMALAKKTDMSDELGTADALLASLAKRAASLPGTTSEYVAMLGDITQPIIDAKLGTQDLEDMTVAAVVAAKALRVESGAAARDVGQAIRGQFSAEDQLTGKLLGARGFKGEEGRKRFNAMAEKDRARVLKEVLTSKQMMQLAEAQGNTFSGVMSTLQDAAQQFFGRVGKPLFQALGNAIRDANAWLDANKETVQAVAEAIGGALVGAFNAVGVAIAFVAENFAIFTPVLAAIAAAFVVLKVQAGLAAIKMAAAWVAALGPFALIAAAVAAIIAVVALLVREPEKVKRAFRAVWDFIKNGASVVWEAFKSFTTRIGRFFTEDIPNAIKDAFTAAFEFIRELPVVKQIIDAISWGRSKAGGAVESAKSVLGRMGGVLVPQSAPALPSTSASAGAAGVQVGRVDVGGINVTAPAGADPQAVAMEVRRVFAAELGNTLRQTMDVVG